MRIDRLFDDLEAAQAAQARAEAREELADAVRVERGRIGVDDRLRGALGSRVALAVSDEHVAGTVLDVGIGWVALDRHSRGRADGVHVITLDDLSRPGVRIVPTGRITAVTGVPRVHLSDEGSEIGRGWAPLLRSFARARASLSWHCEGGDVHAGLVEAVGADHVMLRRHPHDPTLVLLTVHGVRWIDVTSPQG